jgi:hypothetical protein
MPAFVRLDKAGLCLRARAADWPSSVVCPKASKRRVPRANCRQETVSRTKVAGLKAPRLRGNLRGNIWTPRDAR